MASAAAAIRARDAWRRTALGLVMGLVATLAWGGYVIASRFGVSRDGLSALDLAAARFAVAAVIMLPFLIRAGPRDLGGIGWRRGVLLALVAGPPFALLSAGGFVYAPLAHGAAIQPSTATLTTLLLAVCVLGERPGPVRLIGMALVVGGLFLFSGAEWTTAAPDTWVGDLMFVGAGLLYGTFGVLLRQWRVEPLRAATALATVSMLATLPFFVAFGGLATIAARPGPFALQALAQGLMAGVVATIAYSAAVQRLGAARAGVFPAAVPPTTVLLGIPLIGEAPTALQALAITVMTVGLLLAVGLFDALRGRGTPPPAPTRRGEGSRTTRPLAR